MNHGRRTTRGIVAYGRRTSVVGERETANTEFLSSNGAPTTVMSVQSGFSSPMANRLSHSETISTSTVLLFMGIGSCVSSLSRTVPT